MKILIDTSIFLDFYRSDGASVKIFSTLMEHIDKFILTDQIIQEFDRNREGVIKKVKENFQLESKLIKITSSYLKNRDEFKELIEIQKQYEAKQKEISLNIDEIIKNPSLDPIANYFNEFVNESLNKGSVYYTTDEIIKRAEKRKKIGNPPTSDKYSLGDEINWEIVLENVKENQAKLILGRIVDADSVFVNGNFVGTTSYQYPPRIYSFNTNILKEGKNEITVRVINNSGRGGFVTDKPYELIIGDKTIDLKGNHIAAGFIDIQINGGERLYFSQTPTEETIQDIYDSSLKYGTTHVLPCLISSSKETISGAKWSICAHSVSAKAKTCNRLRVAPSRLTPMPTAAALREPCFSMRSSSCRCRICRGTGHSRKACSQ